MRKEDKPRIYLSETCKRRPLNDLRMFRRFANRRTNTASRVCLERRDERGVWVELGFGPSHHYQFEERCCVVLAFGIWQLAAREKGENPHAKQEASIKSRSLLVGLLFFQGLSPFASTERKDQEEYHVRKLVSTLETKGDKRRITVLLCLLSSLGIYLGILCIDDGDFVAQHTTILEAQIYLVST